MNKYQAYPEYQDSGIEWLKEIPKDWSIVPLKYLAELTPKKSELEESIMSDKCTFLPMEKLKLNSITLDEIRTVKDVYDGYTYFKNGDVLIAKVTPCFENKNMAIAAGLTNGIGFGSSEIYVLRPNDLINNRFLYYRLQEDNFMAVATGAMTGAGGLKRVPSETVNNFTIAIPTTNDQTQIAAFLDHETAKIDTLIEKQQQLIELLKEKRQAVISHAVTKGLNPDAPMKDSGVEWLGEVPAHWSKTKLVNVGDGTRGCFVNGPFGSDLLAHELKDEGVPVVYIRDIKPTGYRRKSTVHVTPLKALQLEVCKVQSGDVIVSKVGDPPGDSCVYPSSESEAIITQDVIRIRVDKKRFIADFIAYLLNSNFGRMVLNDISVEGTRKRVSLGDFKATKFVFPPLSESRNIVAYLNCECSKIDHVISQADKAVILMKERRIALISAAVTGKIDVRHWVAPATSSDIDEAVQEVTA
ncbi:restriction endonuclease subunit S [Photobacterium leiognathi]|uniref:restriction endonuclease subunit S n=1 Tax=Photobacterium leiognathi TaxID=553611 RepID=UPI0029820305|nr:restriction endonuclease subunit S [Photobacterium leiognathi]